MLMLDRIIRNFRILMMVTGLGLTGGVSAADIQWTPTLTKEGLTVAIPRIDQDGLVDEIATLKIALLQDEKLLSRREIQKRTSGSNTVMAVLLPGGLIYAAYKKNAHAKVVQELELVSSQLRQITTDLVALTSIDSPVLVAKR